MKQQHPSADRRRIIVIGGGIGGAESALTLALGLDDVEVVLVARWPSLRLLPDLVYVPFGVSPRRLDVPLEELRRHGVDHVVADVTHVDTARKLVHTTAGSLRYDTLVAAPGAAPLTAHGNTFRSLDDALRVRGELTTLVEQAHAGESRTITIRAESERSWTAPACELAILLGAWLRAQRVDRRVELLLATADSDPFEWFGPTAEVAVETALRRARVQVATNVPAGRFDALGGDLVVEFGELQARSIMGLPGRGLDGWYQPLPGFVVARDVHVVGDAVDLPYRAGFATAWQARRVLEALGGDPQRLAAAVSTIPTGSVEYQMDLADAVMRARVRDASALGHPFLGHDADVTVTAGGRPDKLAGLLLHELVLRPAAHGVTDAPLAYRDALREQTAAA